MDELPLTTTMKIKKSELKQKYLLQTPDKTGQTEAAKEAV
jgi:hypothetical protein